jgi:hypothetical protein
MTERDTFAEHDWQLAEDQTLPRGKDAPPIKFDARVWECAKCLNKVYLRNKPPARYGRTPPSNIGGLSVNWGDKEPIEIMGCGELLISHVHDS